MGSFGIELSGSYEETTSEPLAELFFGNDKERVVLDTSMWPETSYVEHWKETAKLLCNSRAGEFRIFTSSLSRSDAVVWPAIRDDGYAIIGNMVVPMTDLHLTGYLLEPSAKFSRFLHSPDSQGSSWRVPISDVRRFAES